MRLEEFCKIVPKVQYLPAYDMKPETEWYGIKALWYEGAMYKEQKTKVFACIGYPKLEEGQKAPAILLIHGGGGHAYSEWIRLWNEKGYVALAMDTTGYFPGEEWKGLVGTEAGGEDYKFSKELYGELCEEGYTTGPDNSWLKDCHLPLEEQWMYHAVASVILARNILANDSYVDSEKIGITGISWGGIITSLTVGYENRFAFAIPIYGSAYLDMLPAPDLWEPFRTPLGKAQWSAADRLDNVNFPMLWQCYCEDTCFYFGANSKSYEVTKEKNAFLSIRRGMGHSHICGWRVPEGHRFADAVLQGKLPLIRSKEEPKGFGRIDLAIEVPEDFEEIEAELFYITEPACYDAQNRLVNEWRSVRLEVIKRQEICGVVPQEAYGYFVEFRGIKEGTCYISSSAWEERNLI